MRDDLSRFLRHTSLVLSTDVATSRQAIMLASTYADGDLAWIVQERLDGALNGFELLFENYVSTRSFLFPAEVPPPRSDEPRPAIEVVPNMSEAMRIIHDKRRQRRKHPESYAAD